MIYIMTGHLGSGKTLLSVQLAIDYLKAGRRVASNMTLYLDRALKANSRATATKLPYIPTSDHLNELGLGYAELETDPHAYDEDKFGLIVLDEAGTWLNSRNWSDKDRLGLFQWITHARKYGWDVALIIQDYESLDAQIRRSVTELFVRCSRLDRIKIPYLPIKLPKMFKATGLYGGPTGPKSKTWLSFGDDAFRWYRTGEKVHMEETFTDAGPIDARGSYTLLSPWHTKGRHIRPKPPLDLLGLFLRCTVAPFYYLIAVPAKLMATRTRSARVAFLSPDRPAAAS